MATKILNKAIIFLLFLSLTACPSMDPCFDGYVGTTKPDLIKITPLQNTYSIGDEIIISMNLPSGITFLNGTYVDIYQKTLITQKKIECQLYKIIEGNPILIQEGNYENYYPTLFYYPNENEYRFKFKVILNKQGIYSLIANTECSFKDSNDECTSYGINTNVEGMNEYKIEFTVQ